MPKELVPIAVKSGAWLMTIGLMKVIINKAHAKANCTILRSGRTIARNFLSKRLLEVLIVYRFS